MGQFLQQLINSGECLLCVRLLEGQARDQSRFARAATPSATLVWQRGDQGWRAMFDGAASVIDWAAIADVQSTVFLCNPKSLTQGAVELVNNVTGVELVAGTWTATGWPGFVYVYVDGMVATAGTQDRKQCVCVTNDTAIAATPRIGEFNGSFFSGDMEFFALFTRDFYPWEAAILASEIYEDRAAVNSLVNTYHEEWPDWSGLVSCWKDAPNAGRWLDLTNVSSGTLTGCSEVTTFMGDGLTFKGATPDVVVLGNNAGYKTNTFTIEAIISFPVTPPAMAGVWSYDGGGTGHYYVGVNTNNRLHVRYLDAGAVARAMDSGNNVFVPGKLSHVIWRVQTTGLAVVFTAYVDGVQVYTETRNEGFSAAFSTAGYIGARRAATSLCACTIPCIAYYNVAKDAAWVKRRYRELFDSVSRTGFGAAYLQTAVGGVTNQPIDDTPWLCGDTVGRWAVREEQVGGRSCKVLLCTTAGLAYVPISALNQSSAGSAYGEWRWWMKHDTAATDQVVFCADTVGTNAAAGQDGYYVAISAAETVTAGESTAGVPTDALTILNGVVAGAWTKFVMTRTSAGVFTLYINNVNVGTWTDTTVQSSLYVVLSLGVGSAVAIDDPLDARSLAFAKARFDG